MRTTEEIEANADRFLARLARCREEWVCPICGKPVEHEYQSGRCVAAAPCGHRLWQGKARGQRPAEPDLRGEEERTR